MVYATASDECDHRASDRGVIATDGGRARRCWRDGCRASIEAITQRAEEVLGRLREVSRVVGGGLRSGGHPSRGAQTRAGGDDRGGAVMHGVDDLRVVDPVEVNARDPEMGMLDMRVIWQLRQGCRVGLSWRGIDAGVGYVVGA